ncbi:MAG: nucleotide sugar dehydrogenase [Candidatus Aminicenantes bacterium]|nr:nucleotide sugar dehydrogenase [Candidatus Aminicenantes bacterium]MDH5467026.1 nucleotide sugar dehydrogenase [Candidatus Aminicenantes bacterium]MDH5706607.1 nucleotide sugar dehydrogenase [Candidatus Aminicenantes bacterium]
MNKRALDLERRIKNRKARIGIIGMGYVGLPLVKLFLSKGFEVLGFDIDEKKVKMLSQGKSYIKHVTAEELKGFIKDKKFQATADFQSLSGVDVVIICVPTPLDSHKNPDLSFVLNTTETISRYLKKGQLVILESTTYPGTTEEKVLPILEAGGLKAGENFFLAYSPERENPGDKVFTTDKIPKIVGGVTPRCKSLAKALYGQVVRNTVPVSSPRVAEATKILENVFRSVNIAMVNEMKMIFDRMGINIWEVIQAASTKPFGYMPFYPGPGLGGHCIPVDPFYLTWKAKEVDHPTKFIELAGEINTFMPYYVVSRTIEALNRNGKSVKGAKILVLGLAYKEDVDDQRESPSLKIISLFKEYGAKVSYNDPYVPLASGYRDYPGLALKSTALTAQGLKKSDAVVIVTAHSAYDFDWIVKNAALVIDTRNAVKKKHKNVIKA